MKLFPNVEQIVSAVLLLAFASISQAGEGEADVAEARKTFIFVETISRGAADTQREHLAEIYALAAKLRIYESDPRMDQLVPRDLKLTPEESADRIAQPWLLHRAAYRTSLEILKGNQDRLAPLLRSDLESKNEANERRALTLISELKLAEYFDAVTHIFQTDPTVEDWAMEALRAINDPRAIPVIVNKNPNIGGSAYEILNWLQRGRPASPLLTRLLDSPDSQIRYRAAYALGGSGDPALIPQFIRLAKDSDPRVREAMLGMGFSLKGENFKKVKPVLVELLSDPDSDVRMSVIEGFVYQKDTVCAQSLLELWRNTAIGDPLESRVVPAVHNLTETYFGYYRSNTGQSLMGPSIESRESAINEFAAWTEKHANKPEPGKSKVPLYAGIGLGALAIAIASFFLFKPKPQNSANGYKPR